MIKAIFFDIDGTLFSHASHTIPASTDKALKKLKEKGILIFIATGRHTSELKNIPLNQYHFDAFITLNGQYCYNNDKVIYEKPVDKNDVITILKEIENRPFPCYMIGEDKMYINYLTQNVIDIQNSIASIIPEVIDLNTLINKPIYQIGPFETSEEQEAHLLSKLKNCQSTRWHDLAIDILHKIGGKQNGIQAILEEYNIKIEETMAFGDGNNDAEMFEFVNISVAMGNAKEELKKCATYITDDIDHDGIYNALIHFDLI
jgi:Cof subfamily protein (haloacid dehalogenase superfamily)